MGLIAIGCVCCIIQPSSCCNYPSGIFYMKWGGGGRGSYAERKVACIFINKISTLEKTEEGFVFHFGPFAHNVHGKGCPRENVWNPLGGSQSPRWMFQITSHGLFRLKPQRDINRNLRYLNPPKPVSDNPHEALTEVKQY